MGVGPRSAALTCSRAKTEVNSMLTAISLRCQIGLLEGSSGVHDSINAVHSNRSVWDCKVHWEHKVNEWKHRRGQYEAVEHMRASMNPRNEREISATNVTRRHAYQWVMIQVLASMRLTRVRCESRTASEICW